MTEDISPAPVRFNLARYCLSAARERPDAVALKVFLEPEGPASEVWTYGEIEAVVLRIAAGLLQSGLNAGDRVLLRIGNTSDFPLIFFGAIAAGIVPIPTSEQLTAVECDRVLDDSAARAVIHDGMTTLPGACAGVMALGPAEIAALKRSELGDYLDTAADDPAFLVYTSGTSGGPKGVMHAQRTAWGRRPMYKGWYDISEKDVLLHAGAFNWTYTLGVGLMDPWANGATSVVYRGMRDPEIWPALLEASGATLFAAVPSLYRRILKYNDITPKSFPRLRHGLTAGEALRPALDEDWVAATGRPLFEALGMSEISTYVSSAPSVPTRPGSPGKPQAGRRIAVLPTDGGTAPLPAGTSGLLCVHRSDPGLMLEYWRRSEETAAAFRGDWFLTGDCARFDEDGYLWYEGRSDDLMNAFGYRVAPEEVEKAIAEHPSVSEVAVTESEVAPGISVITAYVVAAEGKRVDDKELGRWAATRLADYKQPKRFVTVDVLPRTPSGKVMRRALRAGDAFKQLIR